MNEMTSFDKEKHQTIKNRGNYCFLGVSIAFFICSYYQWRIDGLLPAWLYSSIAFASLTISLFELSKDMIEAIIWFCNGLIRINSRAGVFAKRHIELFSQYDSLEQEKEAFQDLLDNNRKNNSIEKYRKCARIANKFNNIATCMEIFFVTIMIVLTPLKAIPYDAMTTKVINVVTVCTFGVLFLSLFINNMIEEEKAHLQAEIYHEDLISTYYLDIIKKIGSTQKKSEESGCEY